MQARRHRDERRRGRRYGPFACGATPAGPVSGEWERRLPCIEPLMMPDMSRVIWLLTGAAWAGRSLVEFAHPDYFDPVTALDWTAVWLYSAALLLFAPSLVLLGSLATSRSVMRLKVASPM